MYLLVNKEDFFFIDSHFLFWGISCFDWVWESLPRFSSLAPLALSPRVGLLRNKRGPLGIHLLTSYSTPNNFGYGFAMPEANQHPHYPPTIPLVSPPQSQLIAPTHSHTETLHLLVDAFMLRPYQSLSHLLHLPTSSTHFIYPPQALRRVHSCLPPAKTKPQKEPSPPKTETMVRQDQSMFFLSHENQGKNSIGWDSWNSWYFHLVVQRITVLAELWNWYRQKELNTAEL